MLQGNREQPNYVGVPSVVFTIPPLARVGLLEDEARNQGHRFRVKHENTAGWYTARRVNEDCAGFKVLIEEGSERILGAHLPDRRTAVAARRPASRLRAGACPGREQA